MALLKFNNVGMTSISGCVPSKISSNLDLDMPEEALEKLIGSIGIKEKRIADADVTSSDLCYKAAVKLLEDNKVDISSIDMLLFLSLTPDYITPPTSAVLQQKLGLPKSTACLDLSLACSGFVYALSTAFAYASNPGINKVLLLVGDTVSKLVNPRDNVNFPLYGDAGTACLVEKGDFDESIFILSSDGAGEKSNIVPHRGFRNILTSDSLIDKERENGNFRKDINLTMDGMDTFSNAIRNVPKQVKQLMKESDITPDDFDYLVSHQSNRYMMEFIMKRLNVDLDKVPFCLEKYGNTGCASVPLTIVSELEGKLTGEKKLLLTAIGAGWSMASAYLKAKVLKISPLIEY